MHMAGSTATTLRFTVRRHPAVLVAPAGPTPREVKRLSDIDDQDMLRLQIAIILFYRRSAATPDPAPVIRAAVAKALVHYYPFAGRVKALEGHKLGVDSTGEGVLFIEADADVRLDNFGDALQPPFPCVDELVFDVPGSSDILGSPLLLFQVTRLECGGFILAVRLNHTMADAPGIVQFLGAAAPTVQPVWGRELLEARDPPRPSFAHREYDEAADTDSAFAPMDHLTQRSFFFGSSDVAALRSHLAPALRKRATTFDVLAACLWKCRTAALDPDANEVMRLFCISNARGKTRGAGSIPEGYHGNAFGSPVAIATAGELRANPLDYAVELVRKAKGEVNAEYIRSVADLLALRGRPQVTAAPFFVLSDVTKAGFRDLDFGWGKPAYGGPAESGTGPFPEMASFVLACKNASGDEGIVVPVPVYLPGPSMERFVREMEKLIMRPAVDDVASQKPDVLNGKSKL